jgi:hypothetical protein
MRFKGERRVRAIAWWMPILALVVSGGARVWSIDDPLYRTVTIRNDEPRRDVAGEIVDAHDGCLQSFEGRYYLYGTAYGASAGFGINNRFRVYSSPDLERWTFEGEILKAPPDGVHYRPYVVFNPNTRRYVLWYNWYPKLWDGQMAVAVSDTPVGPFTIVNSKVPLSQAADRPGDGSLFVDDDGTGYFIYTVIGQQHAIRVERLTRDFLASTGETSVVLARGSEAPVLFRRGARYYALFDSTCCFCTTGSGARVLVADHPLGPYTERATINRDAGQRPIVAAQQTWVARIPIVGGWAFVWMGDRWGSRPDGIKGHDFQFWNAPLAFTADGDIAPIRDAAQWQATVRVGTPRPAVRKPYAWPKKIDPNPLTIDPCTGAPLPPEKDPPTSSAGR